MTEISIAELFEVLSKRLDYIGVESAPPGVSVPGGSLYSSFTLDGLRDIVASLQYGTTIEELVAGIEDYPIELHQLLVRWVGGRRISFDYDRDMVKLA